VQNGSRKMGRAPPEGSAKGFADRATAGRAPRGTAAGKGSRQCSWLRVLARLQLSTGLDEFAFEKRKRLAHGITAGAQQQIATGRDVFLMAPENLAQPAFCAVAKNGVTDGGGRSDDAQSFHGLVRPV